MRSNLLARVIVAGLAAAVVVTVGCEKPTGPSHFIQTALSLYPNGGASSGGTAAKIQGVGFQSGATVTVDGIRVDATVVDQHNITFVTPPHAAGTVDVALSRAPGVLPITLQSGFTYFAPPVITELLPAIGSTGGGTPMLIRGKGVTSAVKVTVGGIESPFEGNWPEDDLIVSTPAHAAGPVEVIVSDPWGQTAGTVFTYASPATFDLGGDWQGSVEVGVGPDWGARLLLTIRDNVVTGFSCTKCPIGGCTILSPIQ